MNTGSANRKEVKFEELFREYFSSLCYFAQKYIADLDSCREIVHSIFVAVWDNRETFDFDKPAKSYLFTSVYNRCMNHIRDQKKFKDVAISEDMIDPVMPDPANLEAAELESRIWLIIESLPEKCREIFILNRFEGRKYAEISDKLNISVKTVETQMSKALKILREQLADYIHIILFVLIKNLW